MSELGSNQGQEENKNAPVFDSANLTDKQKAEHFTNVEGAEVRAKAAEKKAQEARENAIKKAAKNADKEARGSKGGILNFLFGGWHKIVTIAIALVIIIACAIGFFINTQEPYSVIKEKETAARDAALVTSDNIRTDFEVNMNNDSYSKAVSEYEKSIKEANERDAAFLRVVYAEFVYEKTGDFEEAIRVLGDAKDNMQTEVGVDFYNFRIYRIYYKAGAIDDYQELTAKDK